MRKSGVVRRIERAARKRKKSRLKNMITRFQSTALEVMDPLDILIELETQLAM